MDFDETDVYTVGTVPRYFFGINARPILFLFALRMRLVVVLLLALGAAWAVELSLSTRTLYVHSAPLAAPAAAQQLRVARSRLLEAGVQRLAVLTAEPQSSVPDAPSAIDALVASGVVDAAVVDVESDTQRTYPIAIACASIKQLAAARQICDTAVWINEQAAEDGLQPEGRGFLADAIIGDLANGVCYDVSGLVDALATAEAEVRNKQDRHEERSKEEGVGVGSKEEAEGVGSSGGGAGAATDVIRDGFAAGASVAASSPATERGTEPAPAAVQTHKFCMECGVKLPRTAKFCFECGASQPVLSGSS